MLTCLNDIKINVNQYTDQYIKNFNLLIVQQDKDRTHKIDQIMAKIRDENIFKIEGDDSFKEKIYSDFKELLTIKPGRFLIKELIKLVNIYPDSDKERILIKYGKAAFHHNQSGEIEINPETNSDNYYNALLEQKSVVNLKPQSIILAHELIHNLHKRENEIQSFLKDYSDFYKGNPLLDNFKFIKIYPTPEFNSVTFEGFESSLLFSKLDTLEEQHTILGINIARYLKKNKTIDKVDVLSENAFLCAFNLLPRINHKEADGNYIQKSPMKQYDLSQYYQWISVGLNERNEKVDEKFPSYTN